MMTKRDFKILESVHLGLTHYYTDHDVKVFRMRPNFSRSENLH